MAELKTGDRVAAMYLGHTRLFPTLYVGRVKNVTDRFVTIFPETRGVLDKNWLGIGRKDRNGKTYITAPKNHVISIDYNLCG